MKARQIQSLGSDHFPKNITEFDFHQYFYYTRDEKRVIMARHESRSRIGFAIQLGFVRMTGCTLSSLESVPVTLLRHLRRHLELSTPHLASLRTLYRHRRTLFDQQSAATKLLGFRDFSSDHKRSLSRYVRGEAKLTRSANQLVSLAKQWLYDHRTLIPSERILRSMVHAAQVAADKELAAEVQSVIPEAKRKEWLEAVMKKHGKTKRTVLEWLQASPRGRSSKTLHQQLDKLDHLKAMAVHEPKLDGIALSMQRAYATEVRRRRAARLRRLKEPHRTVALVCFLAVRMRELMDEVLELSSSTGCRIVRKASDRMRASDARAIGPLLETLENIRSALQDEAVSFEARHEKVMKLLPKKQGAPSFAGRLRIELSANARHTRPVLRRMVKLSLSESSDKKITTALRQLEQLYAQKATRLPADVDASFAPRWRELIDSEDRQQALRAYESAVLQELRRALRSGAVWADNSLENRGRDEMFISDDQWRRSRDRYYRQLTLPKNPDEHLECLNKALAAGLQALDEAVKSKAVSIDGRRISIAKGEKEPVSESHDRERRRIIAAVGDIQLPELFVEMDTHVRFSSILLGRPPRSEQELLTVYGALLALGTELNAEGVASMIPSLKAETIRRLMAQIQDSGVLKQATEAVVEFLRQHPIVQTWGDGTMMSSDAMSLEATRYLWKARVDPKHRRYAIGIYTHLLNQWSIVYDHPIVLGERQVGVAIDGVLQQNSDANASRVAVDTHGYTNLGMGIVKFLGCDLCPRLRDLRNRILYVPRGIEVPESLAEAVSHDVSIPAIHTGWDPLAQVAASIKTGKTTAAAALRRLGSAARTEPAYRAGTNLGKLHRTLFLLDYFTNPEFRTEMERVLNYGESVHQLQRAIYAGNIPGKQGRRPEALQAISKALTLMTNLVMAWMTHRLQAVVDGPCKAIATPEIMRGIGPDQFRGINLRGQMRFPIAAHRGVLLDDSINANVSRSRNP